MKVRFDPETINSKVKPNLIEAKKYINKANDIAASIKVYDFQSCNYVKNIPGILKECINSCDKDVEWLNNSIVNYSKLIDNCDAEIKKTVVYEVSKKDDYVNVV